MTKNIRDLALACSAAALLTASAIAQENGVATAGEFGRMPQPGQPVWQASMNSGYDVGGAARFDGVKSGDSDVYNLRLGAGALVALTKDWYLNAGVYSDNFALGQVTGDPVPADIHTLRLGAGVSYRWNDQWSFTLLLSPALLRLEDISGEDFDMSGGLLARYMMKPSLTMSFGLFVAPDSDIPVMPIVGLRWKIDDHYTLEVGMPKTRLSYLLEPKWSVYGGLDLNGSLFRANDDFGNKLNEQTGTTAYSKFNNALASYRDIRVGVGTSYEFLRGLRAELEAGYSVYREIDYIRLDNYVRFSPSPYVRLAVNVRF
jgi:hypothetical protein